MSEPTFKAEIAAGGLVWDLTEAAPRLGIVHRKQHKDWTLPKGKFERSKDKSLEDTARREVKEELGCDVEILELAGTTEYEKEEATKVVLYWSMVRKGTGERSPDDEIDDVAWLSVGEAIAKLTYPKERDLVARQGWRVQRSRSVCSEAGPRYARVLECIGGPIRHLMSLGPERDRLQAAIKSLAVRIQSASHRLPPGVNRDWFEAAAAITRQAEAAWRSDRMDLGWRLLLDAEVLLTPSLTDQELIQRAITIRVEGLAKLKGWRKASVENLLPTKGTDATVSDPKSSLPEQSRQSLEKAVMEGLVVLHGHHGNLHYRLRLARRQLYVLLAFLLGSLTFFFWWLGPDRPAAEAGLEPGLLHFVALFGGLGAIVSAIGQVSRAPERKIPESILHGLITAMRPFIGAASALFVYMALESGVVSFIKVDQFFEATHLTIAFVAGFSERLVLKVVALVEGESKG